MWSRSCSQNAVSISWPRTCSAVDGFAHRLHNFVEWLQARASWRWWNFYEDRVVAPRVMLKMNLDETSLCVHQGGLRGTIFLPHARRRELGQRVSKGKRRTNVTLVAIICDDSCIQKRVPQFLIANESTFKAKDMPALRLAAGPNVIVLRRKSAWNNEHIMCSIIRRIRATLEDIWETLQPVLMFDAAALHLTGLCISRCITSSVICCARPCAAHLQVNWRVGVCDTTAHDVATRAIGYAWLSSV